MSEQAVALILLGNVLGVFICFFSPFSRFTTEISYENITLSLYCKTLITRLYQKHTVVKSFLLTNNGNILFQY